MSETTADRCAQLAAGLREAADFIEAHPELPVPFVVRMYAVVPAKDRDQAQRYAMVHDAAEAMQVPVVIAKNGGREVRREFGPVSLLVFTAPDDSQEPGTVIARDQDTEAVRV